MWLWMVSSIAGSLLGAASTKWFKDTKAGLWCYAKFEQIADWATERYGIDMACFCFHHSILKQFSFDGRKMGDLNFLEKIKKNKNFEFKFISLPIGVWGNYDGAKNGKN